MVFLSERRAYYNLERLWAEAGRVELPELTMPLHVEALKEEADPDGVLVFGDHGESTSEL